MNLLISKISRTSGCTLTSTRSPCWALACLAASMKHAQAGAADVVDAGQVEHQMILPFGAALQVRGQLRPDIVGRRLVQTALERQHHDVGETGVGDDHRIPGAGIVTRGEVCGVRVPRASRRRAGPAPSMC